jgi:hypothetical protein
MDIQELIAEIPKLTFAERVAVLASITQSFHEELPQRTKKGASAQRLRGLLKPNFELPPDWDWKKAKADAVVEKYLR